MKVSIDVICKVCKKVFCCAECRRKHERKQHAIIARKQRMETTSDGGAGGSSETATGRSTIYLFCAICEKRPMALHEEMYEEMLEHIERHHLPLHCRKCAKVYTKIDDLKSFSKCLQPMTACHEEEEEGDLAVDRSCDTDASKVTVKRAAVAQTTISTQTSPRLTPGPTIDLRWKAKSKLAHEEFVCDSMSSIKNISCINNSSIQRSVSVSSSRAQGKLVRSTSTPVQAELYFSKPKEPVFNGSGGHVSSICNSACDADISPQVPNPNGASPKQSLDNVNQYRKVGGGRCKLAAVTPLRQVMSKSIQKAIAEHGIPSATAIASSPLDLRLSPALRRTQSGLGYSMRRELRELVPPKCPRIHHEILLSSKKLTTESIVITRTHRRLSAGSSLSVSDSSINSIQPISVSTSSTAEQSTSASSISSGKSIYKTCRSVEIITSTELSEVSEVIQQNVYQQDDGREQQHFKPPLPQTSRSGYNVAVITPITRIPGAAINKKIIKFETPNVESEIIADVHKNVTDASACDLYFTPNTTPTRSSSFQHSSSDKADNSVLREQKQAVPRSLSDHFAPRSPKPRPTLRQCAQAAAFHRIENVYTDDDDDDDGNENDNDDEVFLLPKENSAAVKSVRSKTPPGALSVAQRSSWSLGALLSSVMHLPALKMKSGARKQHDCFKADNEANSILKRCASIAGSLVRPKPLMDEAQFQSLKRKRTYTMDQQYIKNAAPTEALSPNSSDGSTKRFRIQGRQPIGRMRAYTQN